MWLGMREFASRPISAPGPELPISKRFRAKSSDIRRPCMMSTPRRPSAPRRARGTTGNSRAEETTSPTASRRTAVRLAASTPAMPWTSARPADGRPQSAATSVATTERLAPVSTTKPKGPRLLR